MKLTKAQELQVSLRPGDMIIATDIAYFEYNDEVKKEKILSQQPGEIIMVNNPYVSRNKDTGEIYHIGDSVAGTGINGTSCEGRPSKGLGSSLRVGKFRRATPDDPGYMGTREEFEMHDNARIKELTQSLHFVRVISVVSVIMGIWLILAGAL